MMLPSSAAEEATTIRLQPPQNGTAFEEPDEVGEESSESTFCVNVGSAQNGAKILFCTDEWFAASDHLLRGDEQPPTFDPAAYCAQGKVMDGWESRRRRAAGHDWCIIKLSCRADLTSVSVDTAYFTGNHVPAISIQAADLSYSQEQALIAQFPGILSRLLYGGQQGTGCTPDEVASAEAACATVTWTEALPRTPLNPGYESTRYHKFPLQPCNTLTTAEAAAAVAAVSTGTDAEESNGRGTIATHVRLNYYPDGGVARLCIWGIPLKQQSPPDIPSLYMPVQSGPLFTVVSHESGQELPSQQCNGSVPQVSCVEEGGVGVSCSNQHYGVPSNLIQAPSGKDMSDGWETARHPNRPSILMIRNNSNGLVDWTLSDWCILKLGKTVGAIDRIILDTKHFKGNYPESAQVEGCCLTPVDTTTNEAVDDDAAIMSSPSIHWFPLLPRTRLGPHAEHCFEASKEQVHNATKPVSHVRFHIYPDGGLSRVRVYGMPIE
jgi:allantoicase